MINFSFSEALRFITLAKTITLLPNNKISITTLAIKILTIHVDPSKLRKFELKSDNVLSQDTYWTIKDIYWSWDEKVVSTRAKPSQRQLHKCRLASLQVSLHANTNYVRWLKSSWVPCRNPSTFSSTTTQTMDLRDTPDEGHSDRAKTFDRNDTTEIPGSDLLRTGAKTSKTTSAAFSGCRDLRFGSKNQSRRWNGELPTAVG